MEKHIGRDLFFHDAEVDSVNIDRDGTVKVRLWTWSDVDYEHFTFCVWYSLLLARGTVYFLRLVQSVLLICEILYIFATINYEKMR